MTAAVTDDGDGTGVDSAAGIAGDHGVSSNNVTPGMGIGVIFSPITGQPIDKRGLMNGKGLARRGAAAAAGVGGDDNAANTNNNNIGIATDASMSASSTTFGRGRPPLRRTGGPGSGGAAGISTTRHPAPPASSAASSVSAASGRGGGGHAGTSVGAASVASGSKRGRSLALDGDEDDDDNDIAGRLDRMVDDDLGIDLSSVADDNDDNGDHLIGGTKGDGDHEDNNDDDDDDRMVRGSDGRVVRRVGKLARHGISSLKSGGNNDANTRDKAYAAPSASSRLLQLQHQQQQQLNVSSLSVSSHLVGPFGLSGLQLGRDDNDNRCNSASDDDEGAGDNGGGGRNTRSGAGAVPLPFPTTTTSGSSGSASRGGRSRQQQLQGYDSITTAPSTTNTSISNTGAGGSGSRGAMVSRAPIATSYTPMELEDCLPSETSPGSGAVLGMHSHSLALQHQHQRGSQPGYPHAGNAGPQQQPQQAASSATAPSTTSKQPSRAQININIANALRGKRVSGTDSGAAHAIPSAISASGPVAGAPAPTPIRTAAAPSSVVQALVSPARLTGNSSGGGAGAGLKSASRGDTVNGFGSGPINKGSSSSTGSHAGGGSVGLSHLLNINAPLIPPTSLPTPIAMMMSMTPTPVHSNSNGGGSASAAAGGVVAGGRYGGVPTYSKGSAMMAMMMPRPAGGSDLLPGLASSSTPVPSPSSAVAAAAAAGGVSNASTSLLDSARTMDVHHHTYNNRSGAGLPVQYLQHQQQNMLQQQQHPLKSLSPMMSVTSGAGFGFSGMGMGSLSGLGGLGLAPAAAGAAGTGAGAGGASAGKVTGLPQPQPQLLLPWPPVAGGSAGTGNSSGTNNAMMLGMGPMMMMPDITSPLHSVGSKAGGDGSGGGGSSMGIRLSGGSVLQVTTSTQHMQQQLQHLNGTSNGGMTMTMVGSSAASSSNSGNGTRMPFATPLHGLFTPTPLHSIFSPGIYMQHQHHHLMSSAAASSSGSTSVVHGAGQSLTPYVLRTLQSQGNGNGGNSSQYHKDGFSASTNYGSNNTGEQQPALGVPAAAGRVVSSPDSRIHAAAAAASGADRHASGGGNHSNGHHDDDDDGEDEEMQAVAGGGGGAFAASPLGSGLTPLGTSSPWAGMMGRMPHHQMQGNAATAANGSDGNGVLAYSSSFGSLGLTTATHASSNNNTSNSGGGGRAPSSSPVSASMSGAAISVPPLPLQFLQHSHHANANNGGSGNGNKLAVDNDTPRFSFQDGVMTSAHSVISGRIGGAMATAGAIHGASAALSGRHDGSKQLHTGGSSGDRSTGGETAQVSVATLELFSHRHNLSHPLAGVTAAAARHGFGLSGGIGGSSHGVAGGGLPSSGSDSSATWPSAMTPILDASGSATQSAAQKQQPHPAKSTAAAASTAIAPPLLPAGTR